MTFFIWFRKSPLMWFFSLSVIHAVCPTFFSVSLNTAVFSCLGKSVCFYRKREKLGVKMCLIYCHHIMLCAKESLIRDFSSGPTGKPGRSVIPGKCSALDFSFYFKCYPRVAVFIPLSKKTKHLYHIKKVLNGSLTLCPQLSTQWKRL